MTPDDTSTSIPEEEPARVCVWGAPAPTRYDLTISPREAIMFLAMSAVEFDTSPCDDPFCEVCYEYVSSWQSLYSSLDAVDRAAVEAFLEDRDIRAPAHPKGIR